MTWEQKLYALKAIADACLRMRKPGDWYVDTADLHVIGNGFSTAPTVSEPTPEDAVHAYWRRVTDELPSTFYLRTSKGPVRWNGFMWEAVP